jgi:hypothetical protein
MSGDVCGEITVRLDLDYKQGTITEYPPFFEDEQQPTEQSNVYTEAFRKHSQSLTEPGYYGSLSNLGRILGIQPKEEDQQ